MFGFVGKPFKDLSFQRAKFESVPQSKLPAAESYHAWRNEICLTGIERVKVLYFWYFLQRILTPVKD